MYLISRIVSVGQMYFTMLPKEFENSVAFL